MTEDASNIELVPADQMKKTNENANKPGYDSDGNPDIDVNADQPEAKDGNSGDESDNREGIDEDLVKQDNVVEDWDEDEAECADENWADELEGDYKGHQNEEGEREGKGTCEYIDGAKYVGYWKAGKRHGEGTFSLYDGTRFEGMWEKDKKVGDGKLFLSNGDLVEATWENDRMHGKGTITSNGGEPKEYIWYYDMKIDQVDQDACCDRMLLNACCCLLFLIVPIVGLIAKNAAIFGGCVVIWCCNMCEFYLSKSRGYLSKQSSLSATQDKIKHLKKKGPKIEWHIQNYHYETRVTHYRDKDGNMRTRRERVRVNTFYKSKNYKYKKWVDRTPPQESLDYLEQFKLVRLDQPLKIEMADKALKKYRKKKNKFYKKNKVDTHADFWEKRYLKGKDDLSLVGNDKSNKPWFANSMTYLCCSVFFCGWIQRYMLVKNSQRIVFTHDKLLLK
uniref:Uncharacterized protein n=1 Tax=Strombidinopsis acuminata TaxID=141414 RepID=A0A7S3VZY5_9SPIT|mmetsp:Transcript_113258/g.156474  ORF Transcript_113258/g.156474 Transcript_113258/m.156474 type:complete len:448 (+) Transcript_113258:12-1355(+)